MMAGVVRVTTAWDRQTLSRLRARLRAPEPPPRVGDYLAIYVAVDGRDQRFGWMLFPVARVDPQGEIVAVAMPPDRLAHPSALSRRGESMVWRKAAGEGLPDQVLTLCWRLYGELDALHAAVASVVAAEIAKGAPSCLSH